LERLILRSADGGQEAVPAGGLFVLIGASPRTDWLLDAIAVDEESYLAGGAVTS
jgi:thioredoxin reductase (NADPH)